MKLDFGQCVIYIKDTNTQAFFVRSCGGGHKNHANWEFMHTSYPCDHMLVGGFFYAGFEKPLEGRIGSKEHLNMGSITIGHERKLLPITFLNCHAFSEAVFGGGGSLQKKNLSVERAQTPLQEREQLWFQRLQRLREERDDRHLRVHHQHKKSFFGFFLEESKLDIEKGQFITVGVVHHHGKLVVLFMEIAAVDVVYHHQSLPPQSLEIDVTVGHHHYGSLLFYSWRSSLLKQFTPVEVSHLGF